MCLGLPMLVLEREGDRALCARGEERRVVSLALLGPTEPGAHVLVHIDTALRRLEPEEVAQIEDALRCLEAAARGDTLAGFFADLDREPVLPPHLRGAER